MNINLIIQKEQENTFCDSISQAFLKNPKKVHFICGSLKESGFRIIEENFIDQDAKFFFSVGVDKKNTTRNMLETMLGYTKDLYIYSNNDIIEFDSNIFIFEYAKEAIMYVTSSNLSESGIKDNISMYTCNTYDFGNTEDKLMYKDIIKQIVSYVSEKFVKVDRDVIEKLVDDKEIFTTRQYNHSVMSISELLGKSTTASTTKKIEDEQTVEDYVGADIPKIDLSDISIDIDLSDAVENEEKESSKKDEVQIDVSDYNEDDYYENEDNYDDENNFEDIDDNNDNDLKEEKIDYNGQDAFDINNLLFSKADIKLNVPLIEEENEEVKEDELVKVKKVNLNLVTNFIFELPSKGTKPSEVNYIRIPNYIKNMIPEFFELGEKGKNVTINGTLYRQRTIELEIVDVKNNRKLSDKSAIYSYKTGQSYMSIVTDKIKEVEYNDGDIVRIIKLSSDIYHIEIISKDMQEYKLWSKLCTQKFKSSTRKYGMM